MPVIARTRADVDVRSNPKVNASVLDRFPTDCPVEILESINGWFKIKPARLLHSISGCVPQAALIFPPPQRAAVFPSIPVEGGTGTRPSVPPTLKLIDFQRWQGGGGKPEWIQEYLWTGLSKTKQVEIQAGMVASIRQNKARWDQWVAGVTSKQRLEEAVMNEWIAMMEDGREVYAIRDHYVYQQPLQNDNTLGTVCKGQIMRWTGNVSVTGLDVKRKSFYEIEFYRMSRYMRGWFRADIAADYMFPYPENDPRLENNAKTVFDLSKPILRHPQDKEIEDTKRKGYTGAQYIDVFEATRKRLIHFSLCGEFCVATLGSRDILPTLKAWLESKYWRAPSILKDPHEGTSVSDLQSLLNVIGLKGEIYKSIPTKPELIKERLSSGQFAISGCGINSAGKIKADGRIRHWVIVEEVMPVGNSGWVRVYNPFNNREEVYNYNLFMKSAGIGPGLWIDPRG